MINQTVKKGVKIKSALNSSAKATAAFKVWRQMSLYSAHRNGYTLKSGSATLNRGQSVIRCLATGRVKSVFKINNVCRLKMFTY